MFFGDRLLRRTWSWYSIYNFGIWISFKVNDLKRGSGRETGSSLAELMRSVNPFHYLVWLVILIWYILFRNFQIKLFWLIFCFKFPSSSQTSCVAPSQASLVQSSSLSSAPTMSTKYQPGAKAESTLKLLKLQPVCINYS